MYNVGKALRAGSVGVTQRGLCINVSARRVSRAMVIASLGRSPLNSKKVDRRRGKSF